MRPRDRETAGRMPRSALADEEYEEIDARLVWSVHEPGAIYLSLGRLTDAAAAYEQLSCRSRPRLQPA